MIGRANLVINFGAPAHSEGGKWRGLKGVKIHSKWSVEKVEVLLGHVTSVR